MWPLHVIFRFSIHPNISFHLASGTFRNQISNRSHIHRHTFVHQAMSKLLNHASNYSSSNPHIFVHLPTHRNQSLPSRCLAILHYIYFHWPMCRYQCLISFLHNNFQHNLIHLAILLDLVRAKYHLPIYLRTLYHQCKCRFHSRWIYRF